MEDNDEIRVYDSHGGYRDFNLTFDKKNTLRSEITHTIEVYRLRKESGDFSESKYQSKLLEVLIDLMLRTIEV